MSLATVIMHVQIYQNITGCPAENNTSCVYTNKMICLMKWNRIPAIDSVNVW